MSLCVHAQSLADYRGPRDYWVPKAIVDGLITDYQQPPTREGRDPMSLCEGRDPIPPLFLCEGRDPIPPLLLSLLKLGSASSDQ